MKLSFVRIIALPLLLTLVSLLADPRDVRAQKQPGVLPPNPKAPVLKQPFPAGMQRGTTLDLTLTGTNLAEPTALWTSFPAKVTIPAEGNNGRDPAKLLVRLEVPKDAPIGFHSIRLATSKGISNLRIFCIDDLPQVLETNTNHDKATAQAVPVPSVVAGKADAEMSDYFKISVKAGQRLSFEVLGRRLGSGFDPEITLYDAKTGKDLPGGHSNDAPGLQTDPRLSYTFKEAGDVLIEVRDVSYRGGEDFFYRLRIGDFPCATAPLPMAAKRGSKVTVNFAGPMVDGVAPVEVTVPNDSAVDSVMVAPKGTSGLHGWPVNLLATDMNEVMETEPNNEPSKANRLTLPCGVTGRLQEKGDIDHFVFAAKKGEKITIDAQTTDLHSPTEVYMVLRDTKGAQVAATNPATAVQRIDYTAAVDGDFTLAVEHLHSWGGPSECYHLTVSLSLPGFDLSIGLDRFDVAQGGQLSLPILVTRRGYDGEIDVTAVGSKGISGTIKVPAGQPKQPNTPGATLVVKVDPAAPGGPQVLRIEGKATINSQVVTSYVSVRAPISAGLAGLPVPPRDTYNVIGLTVTEKPPFTLTAKLDAADTKPGQPISLTVTVARTPAFSGEIALSANGLPPGVTLEAKAIPANANEIKLNLTPAGNVKPGAYPFTLTGKAKQGDREVFVNGPPLTLTIKK
jgi:hypothetical protein